MNTFKKAVLSLALVAGLAPAEAAITSVRYGIKYNTTTCRYDIYMKVLAGSAAAGTQQQASTAQLSLVVPTGTPIGVKNGTSTKISTGSIFANEPQEGQYELDGSVTRFGYATGWTNSNAAINRTNLSGYDVYSFVPVVSNAFYPTLNTGDSIVLFSLNIAAPACGTGLRLWNNNFIQGTAVSGGDPTSANFGGQDFDNGMGIGSSNQIYSANSALIPPPKPTISASKTYTGSQILLNSTSAAGSACATVTDYRWDGPNGFVAFTQNATVSPVVPASFGTYTITTANNLGCQASLALAVALPVTISKFSGNAAKCAAVLNWETATEANFSRFEVQYSNDGNKFMAVGEVAGKKQAAGSAYTYSYAQASGKGYYRLKMIDLSGMSAYSEVVSVQTNCGTAAAEITIAPNPTSGIVSIRGVTAGAEIRVMDMLGKVVASELAAGAAITVNLSSYANGMYNVLVAQNGGWEKVGQIVKN